MTIERVIRGPKFRKSARLLADALGVRPRTYTKDRPIRVSLARDFFYGVVPHYRDVLGATDDYRKLYAFGVSNKYQQRDILADYDIPVPESYDKVADMPDNTAGDWIIRPLHHSGGEGYNIVQNPTTFREGHEYIQRLFRKTREYRILFVMGQPLIVLRKKPSEGTSREEAWNHSNGSFFQTCSSQTKLEVHTRCVQKLKETPIVKASHIIAADVLWNGRDNSYVVCELNLAPSIQIEENRNKIVKFLLGEETEIRG